MKLTNATFGRAQESTPSYHSDAIYLIRH